MTVRERVLASRLIEKINDNPKYARQIGLSYEMEKLENKRNTDLRIDLAAKKGK